MTPQGEHFYNLPQAEKDKIMAPARRWWKHRIIAGFVVVGIIVAYCDIWNAMHPGHM
jgi:hypothetical protein